MTQSTENNLVYIQFIIAELVLLACKSWTRGAIIPCAWSNFLHSALSPAKLPSVQALWSCKIYRIRGHLSNVFLQILPKNRISKYVSEFFIKSEWELTSTWFARTCQNYMIAFHDFYIFANVEENGCMREKSLIYGKSIWKHMYM